MNMFVLYSVTQTVSHRFKHFLYFGLKLWYIVSHYFELRFSDFGRVTQNVSFDYQYIGYYEEIHEENELFHLGKIK